MDGPFLSVAEMSRYRRPRHHTYDYNFRMGESGYRDMIDYLDRRDSKHPRTDASLVDSEFASISGWPSDSATLETQPAYSQSLNSNQRKFVSEKSDKLSEKRTRFVNGESEQTSRSHLSGDASSDVDVDTLIESIRGRRIRMQQESGTDSKVDKSTRRRIDSGDGISDFGRRTRQAINEIDEDFKELGLYDRLATVGTREKTSSHSSAYKAVSLTENTSFSQS